MRKSYILNPLVLLQLLTILSYLWTNIVNVGEGSAYLILLAAYVSLSTLAFLLRLTEEKLFIRASFFIFILLLIWIVTRIVIDLDDLRLLKALTVATTSGIFLFYIVGAFFHVTYCYLLNGSRGTATLLFSVLFSFSLIVLLAAILTLQKRADIFLVGHIDGTYQRPGNFLSIFFMMQSVLLLALLVKLSKVCLKRWCFSFWLIAYSTITLAALYSAQLFGSNSATAVISGVSVLTLTALLLMRHTRLSGYRAFGSLSLQFFGSIIKCTVWYGFVALSLLFSFVGMLVWWIEFDIMNTNLFGFGSGSINSLTSRWEILVNTGPEQLNYAPFLGNMNVAFLTTGDSGRTLHSLFPFVLANLGFIGLAIVLAFFAFVLRNQYRSIKTKCASQGLSSEAVLSLYLLSLLLFLLVFSNMSVDLFWIVLWFAVGLISQPFRFCLPVRI